MHMYNLSISFDRQMPAANQHLDRLLSLLRGVPDLAPAKFGLVLVYGMGLAGRAVFNWLVATGLFDEVLAFDLRGPAACEDVPVRYASALGDCLSRSSQAKQVLVVNTASPRYVLDVIEVIYKAVPDAVLVQWYDPFAYLEFAHDGYDMYFETLSSPRAAVARELADDLRVHYLAEVDRKYRNDAPRLQWDELRKLLLDGQCDLGTFLDRSLSEILRRDAPIDATVARLQDLSGRFPFYTIALDAAACLLVQHGDLDRARSVFAPAANRYPFSHRILVRLAELNVMAGDRGLARQLCARAAPLIAAGSLLRKSCQDLPRRAVDDILCQWRRRTLRPPRMSRSVALHCATPVWGSEFLDLFMRVTLRSLFAPGNLPHAAARTYVRYTVYTTEQDAPRLRDYPEWERLQELADVRVVLIESLMADQAGRDGNRYDRMSRCQDHALQTSRAKGMATCFPLADLVFSARFIERGLDLLCDGYDTIFFPGMRHSREQMLRDAIPGFEQGMSIVADARALYTCAAEAVHPVYRAKMCNDGVDMHPNSFFIKDRQGNILQQFFAPTPIFIAPMTVPVSIASTLDADLGYSVTDGGLGHYYYVTDTDDMLLLELTSDRADTGELRAKGAWSRSATADWIRHSIDPVNKLLGAYTVCLRRSDGPRLSDEALLLARHVYGLIL